MSIFAKGTLAQTNTVRGGLGIIRNLLESHDFGQGVTTAQLYKLATEVPAPKGFEGDPRLVAGPGGIKGISIPPNNNHPIRSTSFLKRTILPLLVGSGEIRKVCITKEITAPVPRIKKGKVTKKATPETAGASLENPLTVRAWVWRPVPESERFVHEPREGDKFLYTRPRVQKEDISHLNRRRQRSRESNEPQFSP